MLDTSHIVTLLARFKNLNEPAKFDALRAAADLTGGYVKGIEPGNSFDSQAVEIQAHGVFANGENAIDAVRHWVSAASRIAAGPLDADRAMKILNNPHAPDTVVRSACDHLIQHSPTAAHHHAARQVLATLS
jgi:hypothetical protein